MPRSFVLALAVTAVTATPLYAEIKSATQASAMQREAPSPSVLEEITVFGQHDTRVFDLKRTLDNTADTAMLLRRSVGANAVSNGPLSGIAQYRGMSGYRINTQVNGVTISPGGPNWMDPPLSYAPAAHLESLEVYRGIAPVSAGQETIGGVIKANVWRGDFSDGGPDFAGRARAGVQSVNQSELLSAAFSLSDSHHLLRVTALTESGDDASFTDGTIRPTEYERDHYDIGYGYRAGRHTVRFNFTRLNTGTTGTAALPMDIDYIDADLRVVDWHYAGDQVRLNAKVHWSDIEHGMTNFHLRQAPAPGMQRRNTAVGENSGFAITAMFDRWRFGLDGHDEIHQSDISNPNSPMFFVQNFNDARRKVIGAFAEYDHAFNDNWLAAIGIRYNNISMRSGIVNATPASMGMPPAVALRDTFNNADRKRTDDNVDWVVRLTWQANETVALYAGLSQKTRSPSYQERYLWMPLQATAGLADGRTYTGNLDLSPETAKEIELGFDWHTGFAGLSPRIFYRDVSDYIQGTASANAPAVMLTRMMNMMNGTNNTDPLEFNNVDARLYGVDVDWRYDLSNQWSLTGLVNYVRGRRHDVGDDLYRIAPLNALLAVNYARDNRGITLEHFWYQDQRHVSDTNSETPSEGYNLINLKGYWQATEGVRLSMGIDNITDRKYRDHLSGINRVPGNADITRGERLPGNGRSAFLRLYWHW